MKRMIRISKNNHRWRRQRKMVMEYFSEKPKERMYIWASGKGSAAQICIQHIDGDVYSSFHSRPIWLEMDQAKEVLRLLTEAVEIGERRKLIKDEDEE